METEVIAKKKIDGAYIVKSLIGIAIMLFFQFIPAPAPITQAGMAILGQFIGLIFLWSLVDMVWPTFFGMVLFGFQAMVIYPNSWQNAGIYEAGQQSFGNWVTIFVICCLLLCVALEEVGTVRRIVMWFVTRKFAKKSPWTFTFMLLLSALIISMFLDVTPAQFFMLGLAHELFQIFGFKKGDAWPRYMVVGITFTAILGFAMTPICHTLPILWMSIYSAIAGVPSNMLSYMLVGVPVGAVIWLIMLAWLRFVIKIDMSHFVNVNFDELEAKRPGPMEKKEKIVVTISLLVLACWLIPGILALVAPTSAVYGFMASMTDTSFILLGIVALAIIKIDGEPILNISRAFTKISWIAVILLAGIMMIASAMGEAPTGIPAFIATYIVPLANGLSPFALIAVISVLCILLTNIANNVPVGIILISAGVPMCMASGINPLYLAVAVSISANLAFTIPPAFIPVGVAYADPYCNGKTVFKNGLFMTVASCAVCALLIYPIASLVA